MGLGPYWCQIGNKTCDVPKVKKWDHLSSYHVYLQSYGHQGVQQGLTSWGECASLALVGHSPNDGVPINIPYEVDVSLH